MQQTLEQERLYTSAIAPPPPLAASVARGTARKRRLAAIGAVLLLLIAVVAGRVLGEPAAPPIETAVVKRGNIAQTISATGRAQALTTVQVGTQVSGTISEIYVDFNSQVKKGEVIARLDPSQ